MQMITMAALVLDGFAHTAEAVTGAAYGAKNRARFDRAVRLTSEFSIGFAFFIGAVIYFSGPFLIRLLTTDPAVIESAMTYLPYCALAPIAGFAAYQMDGIFIGTTRTAAMRNAGIAAVILYIGAHYLIYPVKYQRCHGNHLHEDMISREKGFALARGGIAEEIKSKRQSHRPNKYIAVRHAEFGQGVPRQKHLAAKGSGPPVSAPLNLADHQENAGGKSRPFCRGARKTHADEPAA